MLACAIVLAIALDAPALPQRCISSSCRDPLSLRRRPLLATAADGRDASKSGVAELASSVGKNIVGAGVLP